MLLEAVRNDKDYYLKAAFNSLEIGPTKLELLQYFFDNRPRSREI